MLIRTLSLLTLICLQPPVSAETESKSPAQDHVGLISSVTHFLEQHANSFPGEAIIKVNPPNPQLRLGYCQTMTPFLPPSSKLWGRMNVGIRCQKGANWQIYLQAELTIKSDYVLTKQALPAGHILTADDLQVVHAELPQFSSGILLKSEQIIGKTLNLPIAQGSPLKQENLKSVTLVSQGQSVKIVSKGPGFQISSEGISLNHAGAGQLVRVKVASGQVIQGFASDQGVIELTSR